MMIIVISISISIIIVIIVVVIRALIDLQSPSIVVSDDNYIAFSLIF